VVVSNVLRTVAACQTHMLASSYTVAMVVGSSRKEYDVLVDTGSSDLVSSILPVVVPVSHQTQWLASGRCGSQACNAAHSRLYDQSGAQTTDIDVSVTYLVGSVHVRLLCPALIFLV